MRFPPCLSVFDVHSHVSKLQQMKQRSQTASSFFFFSSENKKGLVVSLQIRGGKIYEVSELCLATVPHGLR